MANDSKKRAALWYVKWLFASYALALALFLLGLLVSLATVRPAAYTDFFFSGPLGGWAMLALTVAVSPFVYRKLK